MKLRLKIEKFLTEQLWQLLLVVAFVVFCAWIFDKYVQALMFCVAHIIIRQEFYKQYHCGTTALCLFTTLTIAFFGIMTVLPLTISILSTVPMCFFICWVGYIAQDRIDLIAYNKKLKEMPTQTEREKFIEKCKAIGYNELKCEMAVKFFLENEKPKDVWLWLCDTQENPMEWDSVKKIKYRMKKDLFG